MKTLTLVLLALFMLAAPPPASIDSSTYGISTASATTVIRSLPIDPLKILNTWKPLQIERFQKDTAVVLSGNPQIEWTEEKVRRAFDQPIPEGYITAAVAITLFKDPKRGVVPTKFMFVNPLGILEFYIYDKNADTFVRRPYPTQRLV
jgi:hypothetical protein